MLKKLTAIALLALFLALFNTAGARVTLYDTSFRFCRREQAPALRYHSSLAVPEPVPPDTAQPSNAPEPSPEPVPPDIAQPTVAPEPSPEPVPPATAAGASPRPTMNAPSRPHLARTREIPYWSSSQREIRESPLRYSNGIFNNDVATAPPESTLTPEPVPPATAAGASPRPTMNDPSRPHLARTREIPYWSSSQRAIRESPLRCSNGIFNNDVAAAPPESTPAPEPVPPDREQQRAIRESPLRYSNGIFGNDVAAAPPESTLTPEPVPPDRVGAGVTLYDTSFRFWRREQASALRCYSLIALPEPVPPDMEQNTAAPEPVPPDREQNTIAPDRSPEPVPPDTAQNTVAPDRSPEPVPPATAAGASPRPTMNAPSRPHLARTREIPYWSSSQRAIRESPLRCSNGIFNNDVAAAPPESTLTPEPVPPDMAQNIVAPEPVPPDNAPAEPTPAPRSENFASRAEKARNAELGCSFAFFLLAVSAFSMMGALSVCNQPNDEF